MNTRALCLACPRCRGHVAPQPRRGVNSGRWFLDGCDHAWEVIDYTKTAATEEEAVERWNTWARLQVALVLVR